MGEVQWSLKMLEKQRMKKERMFPSQEWGMYHRRGRKKGRRNPLDTSIYFKEKASPVEWI